MKYRTLSAHGTRVSEFCFGTMRYAEKDSTQNERSEAGARALEEAIDRGVNFIHSSYEYQTRWLTGSVLREHPKRNELHHMIKVNVPDWDESRFSAQKFREQVEHAMKELHTEQIAVVQHLQRGVSRAQITSKTGDAHRLAKFDEVASELAEISEKLRSEGKIASVMSFPYSTAYARRAVEAKAYDGLVAYFNPLETEMFEFFPRLQELRKDFISIRPLAGGLLTDRRVDRNSLPQDDRMRDPKMDQNYRQLAALNTAIEVPAMPWEQFAFRFSLAHPVIKSSVLGINTIAHLETAAGPEIGTSDFVTRAYEANLSFFGQQ